MMLNTRIDYIWVPVMRNTVRAKKAANAFRHGFFKRGLKSNYLLLTTVLPEWSNTTIVKTKSNVHHRILTKLLVSMPTVFKYLY